MPQNDKPVCNIRRVNKDSNELYHWKYIRRYWKDGEYKYIYEDRKPTDLKEGIKDVLGYDVKKAYKSFQNAANLDKEYAKLNRDTINEVYNSPDWADYPYKDSFVKGNLMPQAIASEQHAAKLQKAANAVFKEYQKTPLYKAERAIEKGKQIFNKIKNKIKSINIFD